MSDKPVVPKGKKLVCDGDVCKLVDDNVCDDKLSIDDPVEMKEEPKAEGSKLVKMLGEKLLNVDKEYETSKLAELDAVGFYFSAHWCPPCRGFTPKLVEMYKGLKKAGKKLEIVFVSSDRDEDSFKDYYKEMPWMALPFADRKRKGKLSTKYGVQGIPTLVFVDPKNGKLLTADGRDAITKDKEGKNFPWRKPELHETEGLSAAKILTKDKATTMDALWKDNKYLILYFSAHWCPPCRTFTPKFAAWYKKNYEKKRGSDQAFDVVFCSSDRDQGAFDEYYKEHPWKALDYANRDLKEKLSNACGVQGIPTVAVVDKDYKIITTKGRGGVTTDTDCENFPWLPEPILDFNAEPDDINSFPAIILMLTGDSKEDQEKKKAAFKKVALERKAECAKEDEDLDIRFFYVTKDDEGPATQLTKLLNLAKVKDLKLVVCNFNEGKKQTYCEADAASEDNIRKIMKGLVDETLEMGTLKE